MTKHTPGPWRVSTEGIRAIEVHDPLDRPVFISGGIREIGESIPDAADRLFADARIAAAGPEMLHALQRAAHLLAELPEANEPRVVAIRRLAVDAVTKAAPEYYGISTGARS